MRRGRKVAELGTLVIVVVASLWLGKAAGAAFFPSTPEPFMPAPTAAPETLMARDADGEIQPVALASRQRPLITFALSVDCPYCRQTLPYWRDIANGIEGTASTTPEILILSLSPPKETSAYLAKHGLPGNFVVIEGKDLGVLGLPGVPATTVISVDGAPMQSWVGVLRAKHVDVVVDWARSAAEKKIIP